MNKILRDNLVHKHSEFFDLSNNLRGVGFECSDGWYTLIDTLLKRIKTYSSYNKIEPIKIKNIKQKFGILDFYYTGGDDYIRGVVSMAISMSTKICEECGTIENVGRTTGSWIKVICKDCHSNTNRRHRFDDLTWIPNDNIRLLKLNKLLNGKK
jgi:hypothetical protein